MLIGMRCSVAKKQRATSEYSPAMERSNNEKSHIQADVLLMAHRVNSVKSTSTHSHDYMQFKYKCVHFHNSSSIDTSLISNHRGDPSAKYQTTKINSCIFRACTFLVS